MHPASERPLYSTIWTRVVLAGGASTDLLQSRMLEVQYRIVTSKKKVVSSTANKYIKKKTNVVEETAITSSGLDNVKDTVKINSNHYDIHRQRDRRRGFKTGHTKKNPYPGSELE